MRIGGLRYLIKQGWKGMGANRLMTFASVGILTVCLILTGSAALVSLNLGRVMEFFGNQNEIRVFLLSETGQERAQQIGQEIAAIPGIRECTYVSQNDAFTYMSGLLEENNRLLVGYENVFPQSFNVSITDLQQTAQMEQRLSAIEGVDYARGLPEVADTMQTVKTAITVGGWALVVVLGLVSIIVISNTIKLTVFARRREISIMKYVGATNSFIRLPFFVEGVSVGLIAGLLAAGVVCGVYYLAVDYFAGGSDLWLMGFSQQIIPLKGIWTTVLVAFLGFGTIIGGVGTSASIKRHLKV